MCVIIKLLNLGVAQVVARYLGVVEAVGSSPATQTITAETLFCKGSAVFFFAKNACRLEAPLLFLKNMLFRACNADFFLV